MITAAFHEMRQTVLNLVFLLAAASTSALAADSPRERISLNQNWPFTHSFDQDDVQSALNTPSLNL
jgi:hypothetical protein